jgi:hypothetical protein
MATAEARTQEDIAKSVKQLTKLVEMRGGNPAEVKKQRKERQDLLNHEKLLQQRWVEILDEEKQEKRKGTIQVKSLTSFIGDEAKSYFAQTEKNMVTWGGLFKSFGTGVKDWFEAASKQRTMLGATLRLGSSLWKATHDHVIGAIKNVFGKITSQMREVLGELAEVFDVIKDTFKSMFNWLKDSVFGFMAKVPPQDRKRNKLLQKMVDYFRRQEKREFIKMGKATKIDNWLFAGIIMATAFILGAFIRKWLLPFEVVFKALRIGKMFRWVKEFFLKFGIVGRILAPIIGAGGALDNIIQWFGKLAEWMPLTAKWLGFTFKAFKLGFKLFGWPLTLLLGIIDFLWAFKKSTGATFTEKFKDGLRGAVMGFIKLPIEILGFIYDQLTGEVGSGEKWVKEFESFIDPILGYFAGSLTSESLNPIQRFLDGMEEMGKSLDEVQQKKIQPIIDFFKSVMDFEMPGGAKIFQMGPKPVEEMTQEELTKRDKTEAWWNKWTGGLLGDPKAVERLSQAEADKKAQENASNTKKMTDAIAKQTKDRNEHEKKTAEESATDIAVAVNAGGGMAGGVPYVTPELPAGVDPQTGMVNSNTE